MIAHTLQPPGHYPGREAERGQGRRPAAEAGLAADAHRCGPTTPPTDTTRVRGRPCCWSAGTATPAPSPTTAASPRTGDTGATGVTGVPQVAGGRRLPRREGDLPPRQRPGHLLELLAPLERDRPGRLRLPGSPLPSNVPPRPAGTTPPRPTSSPSAATNSSAYYGPRSFPHPDETASTCCGGPPGAAATNTAPATATNAGTPTPTPHHDQKSQQQLSTAAVTDCNWPTRKATTADEDARQRMRTDEGGQQGACLGSVLVSLSVCCR
jgi:hypothetical protein